MTADSDWRRGRAAAFAAVADVYERTRPEYPEDAVRWRRGTVGQSRRHLRVRRPSSCRSSRLLERRLDSVGDERERRVALEHERLARMMGKHEHRVVERRIGPHQPGQGSSSHGQGPPPKMLRPIAVAPILRSDSLSTVVLSLTSPPPSPCCSRHASSANAQSWRCMPPIPGVLDALLGAGDEAVERHREPESEL